MAHAQNKPKVKEPNPRGPKVGGRPGRSVKLLGYEELNRLASTGRPRDREKVLLELSRRLKPQLARL